MYGVSYWLSVTLLATSGVVGVNASRFTAVSPRNITRSELNSRFSSSKWHYWSIRR